MSVRKTMRVQWLLWIVVGLLMAGCSARSPLSGTSSHEPPVAIADAFTMPVARPVTLAWDDLDNPHQRGEYYLYYWQSDWYEPKRVNVGKQTTYTLRDLEAGQTYTFAVTIHDGHGNRESRYSNVVSHRIPAKRAGTADRITVAPPGVLANDYGQNGDALKALLVSRPTNGTVALREDGGFTYTPDAQFHGIDSFTYLITDGMLTSNVSTVTITVKPAAVSQLPSSSTLAAQERASLVLSVIV